MPHLFDYPFRTGLKQVGDMLRAELGFFHDQAA
jgi:hypothetical protein